MRTSIRLTGLAALIAATVSCGDVVRQGSSPVFLVIDQLTGTRGGVAATATSTLVSDVITNVITPEPCSAASPCPTVFGDSGSVVLRAPLKDLGATSNLAPTTNNEVTINRVHVAYSRAMAGGTPFGVDVPPARQRSPEPSAGGTPQRFGPISASNAASQESPLVQLKTSSNIMSVIAVTSRGRSRGQRHSNDGADPIEFGNFGDHKDHVLHTLAGAVALARSDGWLHGPSLAAAPLTGPWSYPLAHRQRHPGQHQSGRRLAVVGQGTAIGRTDGRFPACASDDMASTAWRGSARSPRGRCHEQRRRGDGRIPRHQP
jgi:hypothetical protein